MSIDYKQGGITMYSKDLRRIARESLTGNYWPSVLAAFVAAIFGALISSSNVSFEIDLESLDKIFGEIPRIATVFAAVIGSVSGTLSLVIFILGGVVQLGYTQYLLKQHDRQERSTKDLFSQFDRFGQGFLQFFLRGLYTVLWALLFIIPGIIKAYAYSMTPFIMADNPEMKAKDAIKASQELMKGHKWELFCLEFSFIGWALLNLLTLGIGSLFLNPYINAAYAAFYRNKIQPKAAPVEEIQENYVITETGE